MNRPSVLGNVGDDKADAEVLEQLDELVERLEWARETVAKIAKRVASLGVPETQDVWIDTALGPEFVARLGKIVNLTDTTRGIASALWMGSRDTAAQNPGVAASLEPMANMFAEGMTDAAVTCPCGDCPPCKLRAARGIDVARPEIFQRMRGAIQLPRNVAGPSKRIVMAKG